MEDYDEGYRQLHTYATMMPTRAWSLKKRNPIATQTKCSQYKKMQNVNQNVDNNI